MKVKMFVSEDLPSSGSGERYSSFPNLSLEAPDDKSSLSQPQRKATRKFDALCMLYLVAASREDAEKEPKEPICRAFEAETVEVSKKKHKPDSIKKPQATGAKICTKCRRFEGRYYPAIDYTVSFTSYREDGIMYKSCDRCIKRSAKSRVRRKN